MISKIPIYIKQSIFTFHLISWGKQNEDNETEWGKGNRMRTRKQNEDTETGWEEHEEHEEHEI